MKLKRVWDTTEKKIARVPWANWKPCQVWYGLEAETYFKQDINGLVEITDEDFNVYWPNWKLVESDDVLGYYDTDEPTELGKAPAAWDVTVTFVSDPEESGYVMGYDRDEEQEADVETVVTSAEFPSWINLKVVVWQDTSIQFDDLIEDRHTEYYPVPNGSNTFAWVFIGETEVTDQAIELTQNTTLTVKFNENSR